MKRIIIFGLLAMGYQVKAQPGALDATFGDKGKAILNIANSTSRTVGVAVQPDGKSVIAGVAGAFMVARCNQDGTLDNNFNGKGYDTVQIGGKAQAVIVKSTGEIFVLGDVITSAASFDLAVVKYTANGERDVSFGTSGVILTDIQANDYGYAVAMQPDGKLIAGGSCGGLVGLARYNIDGSLDNTFDDDGKKVVDLNFFNGTVRQIIIQPDNKILIVGYATLWTNNTSSDFILMRFMPDGSFDNSFGVNGIARTDFFGVYDFAYRAKLLPDGKIIAAGYAFEPGVGENFALVKYNADGTLDNGFGTGGKTVTDLGGSDMANGLAIDEKGRIILAGRSDTLCALARYTADGKIDTHFGDEGFVKFSIRGIEDRIEDIALLPDGKIIAVGSSKYDKYSSHSFIARILNNGGVHVTESTIDEEIDIFPNPANNFVYFKNTSGSKIHAVDIIGQNGQLVRHLDGQHIEQFNLDNIPAGSYFFRLYLEGNKTINKPMIISR